MHPFFLFHKNSSYARGPACVHAFPRSKASLPYGINLFWLECSAQCAVLRLQFRHAGNHSKNYLIVNWVHHSLRLKARALRQVAA